LNQNKTANINTKTYSLSFRKVWQITHVIFSKDGILAGGSL